MRKLDGNYNGQIQEETTLESSAPTRRYTISVESGDFVEELDGPFEDDWRQIESLNQAFEFLSRDGGDEHMEDEALTELLGVEHPEQRHNMHYTSGFQTVYQRNGGGGRVLIKQVPDFPVKRKKSNPFRDYIVLEKCGHPMDRRDQRALEDTVDRFIAFGADRKGIENFSYSWEENDNGNRQMTFDYNPAAE